jgi:hypothetical protein
MSNLNNRKSVDPRWTRWALKTLDGFATCVVAIYDPNISDDGDTYNPYAAPTTTEPTMLWRGPGQLQVFRQTLNADDVAGSITQIRSIRFTVPLDGPQVPVRKGLLVRVIECEHDPQAVEYEYTVTSGINSGLAWKRTIEAESDQSVFVTPIGG